MLCALTCYNTDSHFLHAVLNAFESQFLLKNGENKTSTAAACALNPDLPELLFRYPVLKIDHVLVFLCHSDPLDLQSLDLLVGQVCFCVSQCTFCQFFDVVESVML